MKSRKEVILIIQVFNNLSSKVIMTDKTPDNTEYFNKLKAMIEEKELETFWVFL